MTTSRTPRRARGEGTITRRKDGLWQGAAVCEMHNGTRKRMYVYGKTRSDVARKLRVMRQHIEQGKQPGTKQARTGDYLLDWYQQCVAAKTAPATERMYADQIQRYLIPELGTLPLQTLSVDHIQCFVNTLQGLPHLSPRSIHIAYGVLRQALNHAVATGRIGQNPTKHVILPPIPPYEPYVLSEEEARRLLHAVADDRLEALYHVLFLAPRRSEVLNARWQDIDLEKQEFIIRRGKTRASRRIIPLPAVIVQRLREHQQQQQNEQAIFGVEWNPEHLVFPSRAGTRISGRNLIRHFKAMLRKANVPSTVRIHDVRHSAASLMLAQGVPIREVQELLGHATVHTTLRIYAHVIGDGKRRAIDGLTDALMGEKS